MPPAVVGVHAVSEGVPSLRVAKAEAARLGIRVEDVRRTGERRFISPFPGESSVRVNDRRTDATRELMRLIERVKDRKEGTE